MRALIWAPVLAATALMPAALLAQQGATRSVDDYVCAFTDECTSETQAAEGEASRGASKGRTSNTRGFSLSRTPPPAAGQTKAAPAQTATGTRNRRVVGQAAATAATAATPAARPKRAAAVKPAATGRRRVDLRLAFETGSATLTEQAKEEARVFAEALRAPKLADRKFVIEGHTDSVGSRAYNLDLSRRRAEAVVDYLSSLGVSRSRLRTVGYGFDRPLDGRSARAEENRRVEAVLAS